MTDPPQLPERIGRYRVTALLGRGGFGLVYLATDDELRRKVAVKVPSRAGLSPEAAQAYVREARVVAGLRHPGIVQVHDIGSDAEFPCFIVTEYVEGTDLAARLVGGRPGYAEAAVLVARVADALHHAHQQGVVHRDVKPANILIDRAGVPHVLDFGLALRDEDYGLGAGSAGTPEYMSPEQARGEGHRVDGRSDVFSLGVVLYELLTGRRPFQADTTEDVLGRIANGEVAPPRQADPDVPRELDRICLRALARRASDRYPTAAVFAEDLRHWLNPLSADPGADPPDPPAEPPRPDQPPDAFVSYAKPDRAAAMQLVALLEERGVRCWIAPRDVLAGEKYNAAIIRAIDAVRVVFLVLSGHANESDFVAMEVERATSKRKVIVTVRVEDVLPGENLELPVSSAQWVDAWGVSPRQLANRLMTAFRGPAAAAAPDPSLPSVPSVPASSSADDDQALIVPKGPRAFDESDSAYFLRLLPGPYDRNGLPDGARFWKERIDSRDPALAFRVGLVYGPSGCGKSSRVKAALLRRLARTVVPVYLEASPGETEARLLRELRRRVPALPPGLDLVAAMTALQRGQYLAAGSKVAVFLDQFEQYLHSTPTTDSAELVRALRQCDGVRLQCVLMVRHDFWVAVSRFMQALEVPIVERVNARMIDLFDPPHARDVLAMFGQAMGALPLARADLTRDQNAFLDRAVEGLSKDGKVVCVRLSLFAEMVRGKPWTPATIRAVGGIDWIAGSYLEEKFNSANASPQYRQHQDAAPRVLRVLLPPEGTEIKGHMRSEAELREASGYAADPARFDELLRILDGELRFITPADPDAVKGGAGLHYQLTHDYLVPSLRDWINRKKKGTRRGRAELLLDDCVGLWQVRRDTRHLPSLAQWARILWHVPPRGRPPVAARMLHKATRYHLTRVIAAVAVLFGLVYAGHEWWQRQLAAALRDQIVGAATPTVPDVVRNVGNTRPWLLPRLREALAAAAARNDGRAQLNVSLALLPDDPAQTEYLVPRLLDADPGVIGVLVQELKPHREALAPRLWEAVESPAGDPRARLRAAVALAAYAPADPRWQRVGRATADGLVRESPVHLRAWLDAFDPVKDRLITPLRDILREPPRAAGESAARGPASEAQAAERAARRTIASNLLLAYLRDDARGLADALLDADEEQFPTFFAAVKTQHKKVLGFLLGEIGRNLDQVTNARDKERLAQRMANGGVFVLMTGDADDAESVWPLLRFREDPRVRSYVVSRLGRLGADPRVVADRLAGPSAETDVTVRRALVLALGAFPEAAFTPPQRARLTAALKSAYEADPDPGMHAAAEWLLRAWKEDAWLRATVAGWGRDPARVARLDARAEGARPPERPTARAWGVSGEGHTLVAVPAPIGFLMGSPEREVGRLKTEDQQPRRIERPFAVAAHLTTVAQYDRFDPAFSPTLPAKFKEKDHPVVRVTWYEAARYCNWLSRRDGLTPCYTEDAKGDVVGVEPGHMTLSGYRLPTDAEVEYANRAGTRTCRYYGETEELLGEYAWYEKNSGDQRNSDEATHPVGTRKPNDFGLFDMQGNAFTWCHERTDRVAADLPEPAVDASAKRVLRGGAFYFMAISLRAARRHDDVPTMQGLYYGFRVARTLPSPRP